jgi:hypothetical protein
MKIEKNVPMPPRGYELPFEQMEIGDSFLLPAGVSAGYARTLIHKAQNKLDRGFSLRRTDDGYRCWRVR